MFYFDKALKHKDPITEWMEFRPDRNHVPIVHISSQRHFRGAMHSLPWMVGETSTLVELILLGLRQYN